MFCHFALIMCQEIPSIILKLLYLLVEAKHSHASMNSPNKSERQILNFGFVHRHLHNICTA